MKAIVIGGGIGGLSAAITLTRVGIKPLVFEQANALREVGAGLTFWTNGLDALEVLGAAKGVLAVSSPVSRFEQRNSRGDVLAVLPLGEGDNKERSAGSYLCASKGSSRTTGPVGRSRHY